LITRILIQDKERTVWIMILCKLIKMSIGYSTLGGDSIQVSIGVTKLEIFTAFTIKKGWFA
jgi:hypothetical protein